MLRDHLLALVEDGRDRGLGAVDGDGKDAVFEQPGVGRGLGEGQISYWIEWRSATIGSMVCSITARCAGCVRYAR